MAASALPILRGGSGSRTLPLIRPGRSAAKETSNSGLRASARRQPLTARLNGSVGDSFADDLVLMLDAMVSSPSPRSYGERVGVRGNCDVSENCEAPSPGSLRSPTSPRKRGEVN